MKTDEREAYQSSTLFSCFLDHLFENCKNHYLYGKSWYFCYKKRNNNFWNEKVWKKKFLHRLPSKNGRFLRKNHKKKYVFPTLGKKPPNLVLINAQKLSFRDF